MNRLLFIVLAMSLMVACFTQNIPTSITYTKEGLISLDYTRPLAQKIERFHTRQKLKRRLIKAGF